MQIKLKKIEDISHAGGAGIPSNNEKTDIQNELCSLALKVTGSASLELFCRLIDACGRKTANNPDGNRVQIV